MLKTYRYRLYPTDTQKILLNKHIGCCRFIYNLALEVRNMVYAQTKHGISAFELLKQVTELKKEHVWLQEVDSQALQQSILNLEKNLTAFFKGKTKFPNFKSKKDTQSFRNPHGKKVKILNGHLIQPRFTEGIKVTVDRPHHGVIKSTTIKLTPTGKYYVYVLCDTGTPAPVKPTIVRENAVGIDLGLTSFIVLSSGEKVDNPRFLKNSLGRLKVLQRRLRNKKKGSANQKKAYKQLRIIHERVTNQRKDFLQKLSTKLIRENQTICLEDLNVPGMVKNPKLGGSISDAGWATFVEMCKYKADWYGKNLLQIPRFEPSTKICSSCGASKQNLTWKDREWMCSCGISHDRDINAAINIKNYCVRNSGKGIPSVPVELLTLVGAVKQETTSTC